ncbi:TetR/AcrR family transcriptional regulator [Sphingomonas nostoxanthinifaciens]|uniref:TetR/AcrR family transcriptional regulator n=1 Tax=Sphingomonas nostoxanthinifaciens TaxID=2872652 RepID=UPI001CC1D1B2|nr:TetR/AcrR family transcriptional regulator [Sphingomonas nostoxanthinifaciens]UAK25942.1 TetR/AcrR family transcriptional regulator [Sphingomonas nostoxanthinifaciens]
MPDEIIPDLRARLMAAALAALERGEDVGLRAVARDAGVSAMAPYRHFRDKAALLAAVAMRGFDDLRTVLLAADATPDARDALLAQGEAYLAFARARPALFRLMFAGHDGGPPPVEDNAYGVMVRRIKQLAPVDLEAATLACWSAVHGMATLALDGGLPAGGSPHERTALKLIVAGLASPACLIDPTP